MNEDLVAVRVRARSVTAKNHRQPIGREANALQGPQVVMVEGGRDDVDDDPTVPRSGVRLLPDEEPAQGVGGGLGNGGYGKHAFTVAAHQRQISRASVREPSRRDSSTLAVVSWARFGAQTAYDVVTVTDDIDEIRAGFWAIVLDFESTLTAVRFAHQGRRSMARPPGYRDWRPLDQTWRTSLDHVAYTDAVREVRRRVAAGTVYQASICRVLSHDLDDDAYLPALARLLTRGNPAPYAATIHAPEHGLDVVCASPELYLRRDGDRLVSKPIKGTSTTRETMLPKDYAENVMITDLVRNDLQTVCRPGTVAVDELCAVESHPGLVHLVTDVSGQLCPGVGWREILEATFPPGSVSGAPKSTALAAIADLEPVSRGPYCGAIGWIDADRERAELAVGIRTFWATGNLGARVLNFGAGAGITWGSDPEAEWLETQLKAARLIGLASGTVAP